ncbi:MAG: hypothetical protein ABH954_01835 [Candidatus Omnitrophota bacterium]
MDKLEDYFRREEESLLKKDESHPQKEAEPHPHHLRIRVSKFFRDAVLVLFAVFLSVLFLSMFKQQEKVNPEMEKRFLKLLKDKEERKRMEKMVDDVQKRGIDVEEFIK